MKFSLRLIAMLGVATLSVGEVIAAPITLNLVPANSHITLTGTFNAGVALFPITAQDSVAGVTDYVPGVPSTKTTFQGTITVDVDNLFAPTSIKIVSSAADADLSGKWLPEVEPYLDLDMDGNFGEFGPDSLPSAGDDPAPATDADWGIRVAQIGALGAYRDIVYNVTMPASVPVDGLGQFSSLTENFEFATGWLDYWISPAALSARGRAELAGGDDNNMSAAMSKYTVTPLGGGLAEIKLFIPISIDDMGSTLRGIYTGQFEATLIVPEPSTLVVFGMALAAALMARRRK